MGGRSPGAWSWRWGLRPARVVLVVTDPNEGMFFPLSTAPLPAISGAVLLCRAVGRSRVSASRAPADRDRQAHSQQWGEHPGAAARDGRERGGRRHALRRTVVSVPAR